MKRGSILFLAPLACLASLSGMACSDDEPADPNCDAGDLPLSGPATGPVLTDAALECQGNYVNLFLTATDPQGDADLQQVVQRVRVFESTDCAASARTVTDDLAGSGIEESFGIVFTVADDPGIVSQICAADRWPIAVELADASGDTLRGQVLARVIH